MEETSLDSIVLKCNQVAMSYLQCDDFKECFNLLKRAEDILTHSEESIPDRFRLLGITLNNLGCYYKRRKQLNVALEYLKRAVKVELQIENDSSSIASTHLNIAAIYSSLTKHAEALKHAELALNLLEQYPPSEPTSNYYSNLAISYYNAGVELEHLNRLQEAWEYLNMAGRIAKKELGAENPLTVSVNEAYDALNTRLSVAKTRVRHRGKEPRPVRGPQVTNVDDSIPATLEKISSIASRLS